MRDITTLAIFVPSVQILKILQVNFIRELVFVVTLVDLNSKLLVKICQQEKFIKDLFAGILNVDIPKYLIIWQNIN